MFGLPEFIKAMQRTRPPEPTWRQLLGLLLVIAGVPFVTHCAHKLVTSRSFSSDDLGILAVGVLVALIVASPEIIKTIKASRRKASGRR
jgi:Ca2+/H+ antiporter